MMSLKNWLGTLAGGASASDAPEFSGYVHDIDTARRLFCPYGTTLKSGDRVMIHDEKTVFGRVQRERLVEVTEVRDFRSNGRLITLGSDLATPEEVQNISSDSDIAVDLLLLHRKGTATYDAGRPPVVVYFEPVEEN